MLTSTLPVRDVAEFAADVRESLTKPGQRELPSKYLYDEVGSALFEAICVLPEYGLTRADARLLEKYAREIVRRQPTHNLSRILFQQTGVGPCQPVLRQHANRFKQRRAHFVIQILRRKFSLSRFGEALSHVRRKCRRMPKRW